jgi:hypothetical protein
VAKGEKDGTSITSSTSSFNDRVKDLKAYKEKYGHVNVSWKTDKSLYQWCANMRSARRNPETCKRKLKADHITVLDAIGFHWKTNAVNSEKKRSFQNRLEQLRVYRAQHGHSNVKLTDDKSLYNWCAKIRSAQKGTGTMNLTTDRIAALNGIGFDWKIGTACVRGKFISFQDRVKALSEYKEKNGHLNVTIEDNKKLNDWCANIRNARKGTGNMKLTADRIAALDAVGFDWRSSFSIGRSETTHTKAMHISFHDRVAALREYKEKNGHLSITQKDDKSLYDWCSNIRNARRGKLGMNLTADRIAALDDIGFDWRISNPILQPSGSPGQIFQVHVEALREYKKNNGHLNISREIDKSLFNWCSNIRCARRGTGNMKLTANGIAALDVIGFDWGSEKKRSFQNHVNDLKAYKAQHGHLTVSKKDNKSLYDWCSNIRHARNKPGKGKMKLTTDQIAALDAIGFDWRSEIAFRNCQKPISFIDRVEALRAYKEKHGHLNISREIDKSLEVWCSNIRSARNSPGKGKMRLTQEGISALDAIGFDWRGETRKISFIDRVEALKRFKEKHGHLNVTHKANKSLYSWCINIRCAKSGEGKFKLTQERIAALDAIGFDWRLSKSVLKPFDSLGDDADKASGKSEENHKTVQDCQYAGDGFHHDDLEHVEIPNASVTFQEISIDSLTKEEKILFDMIESSISAAE